MLITPPVMVATVGMTASPSFLSKVARQAQRVKGTLKLAFITAAVMGVLFFTLCQVFPETILRIYMEVNDEVLAVGPRIVRLYSISVLVVGFCFVCNYFFQSTLLRSACVLISLLRGLVLPVTLVLTLPLVFGYDFIWLGAPLGEILTAIVAILIFIPRYNKLRRANVGELVDCLPITD